MHGFYCFICKNVNSHSLMMAFETKTLTVTLNWDWKKKNNTDDVRCIIAFLIFFL